MTDQQAKARRGCFFYGCIVGLLMMFVVVVAGLLGLRYAKKMVTDFTDTSPATLPTVNLPPAEIDQLNKKVDGFREGLRNKTATAPLTLSADELNALIATNPDLQQLKGKLYVSIEGDQLKGQVSVPMEDLGLPAFRGRYLNGKATFSLALKNGMLRLTAQHITVKDKPMPDIYMQKIRTQNFGKNINSDPRASAALNNFQEIQVNDGRMTFVPKPNQ
jgi:hypothetical protein